MDLKRQALLLLAKKAAVEDADAEHLCDLLFAVDTDETALNIWLVQHGHSFPSLDLTRPDLPAELQRLCTALKGTDALKGFKGDLQQKLVDIAEILGATREPLWCMFDVLQVLRAKRVDDATLDLVKSFAYFVRWRTGSGLPDPSRWFRSARDSVSVGDRRAFYFYEMYRFYCSHPDAPNPVGIGQPPIYVPNNGDKWTLEKRTGSPYELNSQVSAHHQFLHALLSSKDCPTTIKKKTDENTVYYGVVLDPTVQADDGPRWVAYCGKATCKGGASTRWNLTGDHHRTKMRSVLSHFYECAKKKTFVDFKARIEIGEVVFALHWAVHRGWHKDSGIFLIGHFEGDTGKTEEFETEVTGGSHKSLRSITVGNLRDARFGLNIV